MNTDITNRLWDRQPNESEVAYHSFTVYLNLPPPRKYKDAAEILDCTIQNIRQMGARHNWRERVRLYDKYIQTMSDEERIDILRQFQEEIVTNAAVDYRKAVNLWDDVFEAIHDKIEGIDDLDIDGLKDLTLAIDRLVNMRKKVDDNARRAARLPNNYKSAQVDETPLDEGEFIISVDKPPMLLSEEPDD